MSIVQDPKFYQKIKELEAKFIEGQQIADHLTAIFPIKLYLDKIIWVSGAINVSRVVPSTDSRQNYEEFIDWSRYLRFEPSSVDSLCIGFWDERHNLFLNYVNGLIWALVFRTPGMMRYTQIRVDATITLNELLEDSNFSQYLSYQILEIP